jgi:hypothetical protein
MIFGNAIFNASMALFRREFIARIPDDYLDFHFCGDWLFWMYLMQHGDVYISGKVLNYFRNHSSDVSSAFYKSGKNTDEEIQVIEKLKHHSLIDQSESTNALKRKYYEFLQQAPLIEDPAQKKLVKKTFRSHLPPGARIAVRTLRFLSLVENKTKNLILRISGVNLE